MLIRRESEGAKVVQASLEAAAIMPVAGRPYGPWLDWVRSWFGVPTRGVRSTSPQE
jgi:hypothetical protein